MFSSIFGNYVLESHAKINTSESDLYHTTQCRFRAERADRSQRSPRCMGLFFADRKAITVLVHMKKISLKCSGLHVLPVKSNSNQTGQRGTRKSNKGGKATQTKDSVLWKLLRRDQNWPTCKVNRPSVSTANQVASLRLTTGCPEVGRPPYRPSRQRVEEVTRCLVISGYYFVPHTFF